MRSQSSRGLLRRCQYAPDWTWTNDVRAAQHVDEELAERVAFIESG